MKSRVCAWVEKSQANDTQVAPISAMLPEHVAVALDVGAGLR